MSKPEIKWLNEHNTSIQEALLPLLQEDRDAQVRDWLKRACKPHRIWPWMGV
jgi:Xaa-Pro aminopeptidase